MKQIQWFPGHMHKTRKKIKEQLKNVDLVIEVLDARAPLASANPLINEICGTKPRLILLNKSDLADPLHTRDWSKKLADSYKDTLAISIKDPGAKKKISRAALALHKGMRRKVCRALIVGIPNVGKSSILNLLAGKRSAAVGNRPAVTRQLQKVNTQNTLSLIDSPGVLWPKFEDRQTGIKLAILGTIKDEILNLFNICESAFFFFKERYPHLLKERYSLDPGLLDTGLAFLGELAQKRGFLVSGGECDYERAQKVFLKELRDGKIGRISLEEALLPSHVFYEVEENNPYQSKKSF